MQHQIYQPLTKSTHIWKLLPWAGLICLFLAVCCAVAALVIGMVSDGVAQNSWELPTGTVQPSVLLSLVATLCNAALRVAFTEGAIIMWWIQAQRGVSVDKLYTSYEQAHNFTSLFATTNYTRVTVAAVAMLLLLADGPFLQKASTVQIVSHPKIRNLTVPVSPLPLDTGATSFFTAHAYKPNLYTPAFAQVAQDYETRKPISIPGMEHDSGSTTMELVAPGWDIRCLNGSKEYRLMSYLEFQDWVELPDNQTRSWTGPPLEQSMFNTTIQFDIGSTPYEGYYGTQLLLNSSYKSTPGGNGTLSWHLCTFSEALIRYPLKIDNGTVTLQSMPLSENRTEHFTYNTGETSGMGNWPSTLGGLWLALSNQFESAATMLTNQNGASILNRNTVANQFLLGTHDELQSGYNVTWSDPIENIIMAAHELFLRTAIALSNGSGQYPCGPACPSNDSVIMLNRTLSSQNVTASVVLTGPEYNTDLAWLIGGVAIMIIACIAIAPMYWGWWRLERPLTMNPFETGKAFESEPLHTPLLCDANPGVSPAAWSADVKNMQIQYGHGMADLDDLQDVDTAFAGSETDCESGQPDVKDAKLRVLRFRKVG